jgi:hypothetical protein
VAEDGRVGGGAGHEAMIEWRGGKGKPGRGGGVKKFPHPRGSAMALVSDVRACGSCGKRARSGL